MSESMLRSAVDAAAQLEQVAQGSRDRAPAARELLDGAAAAMSGSFSFAQQALDGAAAALLASGGPAARR